MSNSKSVSVWFLFLAILLTSSLLRSQDEQINDAYNEIKYMVETAPAPASIFQQSDISIDQLKAALKKDIFNYFDDLRTYDSELKRKMFLKSTESKIYIDSLTIIRNDILKTSYKLELNGSLSDYDLKTGQFTFTFRLNGLDQQMESNNLHSSILKDYKFKSLSFKEISGDNTIKIKIEKKKALDIEENARNIKVYFVFSPSGIENLMLRFKEYPHEEPYNVEAVTVNKVRVVFVDDKNERVYADKTF